MLHLLLATKLPNGRDLPPLFNFTENELKIQPTLNSQLIPPHVAPSSSMQGAAGAPGDDPAQNQVGLKA